MRYAPDEHTQSSDLEQVRPLLIPQLSPEEGRRRIEAALAGAADDERAKRIEELAEDPDLAEELVRRLSAHREDDPS